MSRRRLAALLVAGAVLATAAGAVAGEGASPLPVDMVLTGRVALAEPGHMNTATAAGRYAYVAAFRRRTSIPPPPACTDCWDGDVHVVDLETPGDPTAVGAWPYLGTVVRLVADGARLYVGATDTWAHNLPNGSFYVLDVADPARPRQLSATATRGHPVDGIAVVGTLAYLVCGGGLVPSFEIHDLTDPGRPTRLGVVLNQGARDVAVVGRYAYLGTGSGLVVFDVADPRAPVRVATAAVGAGEVEAREGRLYVSDGPAVAALELTDPTAPTVRSRLELPTTVGLLVAGERYLYAATVAADASEPPGRGAGVHVLDFADPDRPRRVGYFPTGPGGLYGRSSGVGGSGDRVVATAPTGELWRLRLGPPAARLRLPTVARSPIPGT